MFNTVSLMMSSDLQKFSSVNYFLLSKLCRALRTLQIQMITETFSK